MEKKKWIANSVIDFAEIYLVLESYKYTCVYLSTKLSEVFYRLKVKAYCHEIERLIDKWKISRLWLFKAVYLVVTLGRKIFDKPSNFYLYKYIIEVQILIIIFRFKCFIIAQNKIKIFSIIIFIKLKKYLFNLNIFGSICSTYTFYFFSFLFYQKRERYSSLSLSFKKKTVVIIRWDNCA